ncbi:hypothetical protein RCL1_000997 [Eukaryota sp. TZLM3-RCL]
MLVLVVDLLAVILCTILLLTSLLSVFLISFRSKDSFAKFHGLRVVLSLLSSAFALFSQVHLSFIGDIVLFLRFPDYLHVFCTLAYLSGPIIVFPLTFFTLISLARVAKHHKTTVIHLPSSWSVIRFPFFASLIWSLSVLFILFNYHDANFDLFTPSRHDFGVCASLPFLVLCFYALMLLVSLVIYWFYVHSLYCFCLNKMVARRLVISVIAVSSLLIGSFLRVAASIEIIPDVFATLCRYLAITFEAVSLLIVVRNFSIFPYIDISPRESVKESTSGSEIEMSSVVLMSDDVWEAIDKQDFDDFASV